MFCIQCGQRNNNTEEAKRLNNNLLFSVLYFK